MSLKLSFTVLAMVMAAMPALAADPLSFTYESFEAAVPHVDLDKCPDSLPQKASFCRASVNHSEIHVFVFSEDGDSPLIGFASYPAEQLGTLLK